MGIPFCVLPNEKDGTISVDRIRAAIKPDNVHYPVSRVVALENTQNRCVVLLRGSACGCHHSRGMRARRRPIASLLSLRV